MGHSLDRQMGQGNSQAPPRVVWPLPWTSQSRAVLITVLFLSQLLRQNHALFAFPIAAAGVRRPPRIEIGRFGGENLEGVGHVTKMPDLPC